MSQITAYKCDICKALSETKPHYFIDSTASGFEVRDYSRYPSIDIAACSVICLAAALDAWTKKIEAEAAQDSAKEAERILKASMMMMTANQCRKDRAEEKVVGDEHIISDYRNAKFHD